MDIRLMLVFRKNVQKNKKTVFLHIGMPKTGTTSIQNLCHKNRRLLARYGIQYPISGLDETGHHVFAASLFRSKFNSKKYGSIVFSDNLKDELVDKLTREILSSKTESVLLSSEVFWKMSDYDALKKAFQGFSIKIILYLRRQDFALVSHYSMEVKWGSTSLNFPEYLTSRKDDFCYLKKLCILERVFGKENLDIRVFDERLFLNGSLWADFLSSLGVPELTNKSFDDVRSNQSLTLNKLEFKRALNSTGINRDKSIRVLSLLESLPDRDGDISIKNIMSTDDREKILNYYRDENNEIFKMFFSSSERDELFDMTVENDINAVSLGDSKENAYKIMSDIIDIL